MQDTTDGEVTIEMDPDEESAARARESLIAQLMPTDPIYRRLAEEVVNMSLKTVGSTVITALSEKSPRDVIDRGLSAGMSVVAKLYADQIYRLPEIMMAAKTMEIGVSVAEDAMAGSKPTPAVRSSSDDDPHDIAQNVGNVLLKTNGFDPVESGSNMPVMVDVVSKYVGTRPQMVPGTTLMTSTMKPFPGRSPRS